MVPKNPTPVQIGMKAVFDGQEYLVQGYLVFSMQEEGETYYWHEFVLYGPGGSMRFLEYENDDGADLWQLVAPFNPPVPLTPSEASALSVGDTVQLDRPGIEVTEATEGRTCAMQGLLAGGEAVGECFRYFDGELGDRLYSAEWDASGIEFFAGYRLTPQRLGKAFKIDPAKFRVGSGSRAGLWVSLGVVGAIALTGFLGAKSGVFSSSGGTNSVRSVRQNSSYHFGK